LLLLGLASLYVWSSEAYDALSHLPVLFQWQIIVAFSLFAFLYAVTVREFRTEWHEKCAARVAGAVGVVMLIGFSFRMTCQVDRLQNQIAVRGVNEKTTPVAQQIVDLVAQEAIAVETPSGRTVSWRGDRPVSIADRRIGLGVIRDRNAVDFARRPDRRLGGVSIAPSGSESTLTDF
jgi:hypothetical protein